MDPTKLQKIEAYKKREKVPRAIPFTRPSSFVRSCNQFEWDGKAVTKNDRPVLSEPVALKEIQRLHKEYNHLRGKNLAAKIRALYSIQNLRQLCYRVGKECGVCDDSALHKKFDGCMIHPTDRQLDRICDLLEVPETLRSKEKRLSALYVK